MVKVREDLTGKTFGRLTVLEQIDDHVRSDGTHIAMWLCECECENHTILPVQGVLLKRGKTKSCGCIKKEQNQKLFRKTNAYDLSIEDESGLYGIGYCNNTGNPFYFDMDDYDKIKNYCWYEYSYRNKKYNCLRAFQYETGMQIKMHHIIMGKYYDHIDRNPLNNRKNNLRQATNLENARNKSMTSRNTSGFIGVYWIKKMNKWSAQIGINNKMVVLGYFENKEDAIRARLEAEAKYFGEFAPQQHLFEQYKINVKDGDANDLP
jgi:hypothetical protein